MTGSLPARGYTWPPFEAGNVAALKHGAHSERKVAPLAAAITAELVAIAPWSTEPAFAPTLAALARVEAQVLKVEEFIDEHGPLDDAGVPRPAMALLSDLERRADRLRQQFGLSPTSWAALRRSFVVDPDGGTSGVEALRASGRRVIEAWAGEDGARQPTTDSPVSPLLTAAVDTVYSADG